MCGAHGRGVWAGHMGGAYGQGFAGPGLTGVNDSITKPR